MLERRRLLPIIQLAVILSAVALSRGFSLPSWSELSEAILPTTPPPPTIDCYLEAKRNPTAEIDDVIKSKMDPTLPTLYRERNGWCVHSARLWFALEAKGIDCNTVLVEARGDTYDGSPTEEEQEGTDGRPEKLIGLDLPQLEQRNEFLSGAGDEACLSLLERLDELFPEADPIWPPLDDDGAPACKSEDINEATRAFVDIAPNADMCRLSSRAAWLFCSEEGYRLDPLPRETFESVLDATNELLGQSNGPYFTGEVFSAADIYWSPLLERYAAQLPCLHEGLYPRGKKISDNRWPHLTNWYDAMNKVPAMLAASAVTLHRGVRYYIESLGGHRLIRGIRGILSDRRES